MQDPCISGWIFTIIPRNSELYRAAIYANSIYLGDAGGRALFGITGTVLER